MQLDDRLRQTLQDLNERAHLRVKKLETDLDTLTRARQSESDDDEHDPEGVPLSSEWSRLTGLLAAAKREAQEVEQAQQRLSDGSYGICVGCGKPIAIERLEVRPFAERCVPCAT